MIFNIGDLVRLDQFKVEGKVLEISESTVLIEHRIIHDGVSKIITQWYSKELVTDVRQIVENKVKLPVVKSKKNRVNKKKNNKIEFGIIPDTNK